MTLGNQFQSNVWTTGKVGPIPGTAKHPQGRLMRPEYTGDPDRMSPENWLANDGHGTAPSGRGPNARALAEGKRESRVPTEGKDVLTWHSNHGDMPDYENEGRFEDAYEGRVQEDQSGRLFTEDMGYAIGTHTGTIKAGYERQGPSTGGTVAHPVKFERSKLLGDASGPRIYGDYQANHSSNLTDNIEAGGVVAYGNDVEDAGSISYRGLRDTYRTWNDDMDTAINKSSRFGNRGPRPQYVEAHKQGYAPAVQSGKLVAQAHMNYRDQQPLPTLERFAKDYMSGSDHHTAPIFNGEQWTMRKKTGE